ncbi:hypothetical protein N0B31_16330 [Salinirubellus salinus]|uniref:Uncharacterized protein n=1 Tax=Salinirubellus salinus TaxID=1364945 RepID=A0A9E7R1C3_9EURY|nr:hypothetical protein [Salinirubellus salinus]UWM53692.1 hypothetical protein N0B31_16330 [Salinirubellus salinus]
MNVLSKLLFQTISIQRYKSVREDFLRTYRAALTIPEIRGQVEFLSNSQLREQSKEDGRTAPEYDPHAKVHKPLKILDGAYRFLWAVLAFCFVLALPLSAGINTLFKSYLQFVDEIPNLLLSFLPFEIVVVIMLYLYLLGQDSDLIRRMNDGLRITSGRIEGTRRRDELLSFYVWNSSLHSRKKIPVLGFLVILNTVGGRMYRYVMDTVEQNVDILYYSDGYVDAITSLARAELG